MDKSLLKAKRKETRSKPAQMVTKSITMLRDVDTRVVEKLNDVEREKLRQQVSKLSQMVDQFDILFDDGAENDRVPTENADASQSKRYCIAPRSLEDPEVVCTNLGKPVTGLTFSMGTEKTTIEVIEPVFEEFERVRIPAKGITGYIVDVYNGDDGKTYYLVENEEWGDVDDPDAWNIGYAHFDCTADQLAKIDEEAG